MKGERAMKKSRIMLMLVMFLVVAMIASFTLIGCKEEVAKESSETAEEASVEEKEEVAEEVAEEVVSEMIKLNAISMAGMMLSEDTFNGLKELGIDLTLEEQPYEGYREKLITEWATGGKSYDIAAVSDEWIADFVTPGYLSVLDDYVNSAPADWDFSDFYDTPINLVSKYPQGTGEMYTIPFLTFCLELAYNEQMMKDVGISEPPKTLDEFLEVCKKLTIPEEEKYAFAPLYLIGETVTIQYEHWHRVFTGLGGVLDENNNPQVNTPGSIEALEFMI